MTILHRTRPSLLRFGIGIAATGRQTTVHWDSGYEHPVLPIVLYNGET